jgi:DNA polymerase-3 subunit alpha
MTLSQQHTGTQELTVISCGIIKSKRTIITKKGDPMAFMQLEDTSSTAEIILFPKIYKKVSAWLDTYQLFVVKGTIDLTASPKCKIKANECIPLDLIFQEWPSCPKISLQLPLFFQEELVRELQTQLKDGSVPLDILFNEQGQPLRLATRKKIALDVTTLQTLELRNIVPFITL